MDAERVSIPLIMEPKRVAEILGVSQGTVYVLIKNGELPCFRVTGHRPKVTKWALLRYIQKQEQVERSRLTGGVNA